MSTKSISGILFDDLIGNIPLKGEELQVFKRLGIDGIGARLTGKRTTAIEIESHLYIADFAAAKTLLASYKTLIGANPVAIIQHDVNYGTYLIAGVEQVSLFATASATGTINNNPTAKQICKWIIWG